MAEEDMLLLLDDLYTYIDLGPELLRSGPGLRPQSTRASRTSTRRSVRYAPYPVRRYSPCQLYITHVDPAYVERGVEFAGPPIPAPNEQAGHALFVLNVFAWVSDVIRQALLG